MSYVSTVLQENEIIRKTAKIHWIAYFRGFLFLTIAVAALAGGTIYQNPALLLLVACPSGFIAVCFFLSTWIRVVTTEIAVTDRRVLLKTGFIRRDTIEMNINQVESVKVDQSILGRLLNYGTVTVRGTGQGIEPLTLLSDPLSLRSAITSG